MRDEKTGWGLRLFASPPLAAAPLCVCAGWGPMLTAEEGAGIASFQESEDSFAHGLVCDGAEQGARVRSILHFPKGGGGAAEQGTGPRSSQPGEPWTRYGHQSRQMEW